MSRVLMVDDASLFRMLEASFLRRTGCEIVRADSGPEVVSKARVRAPDLILLDADRPGLDGPACLRALKEDPALRTIPVLMIASPVIASLCARDGADATLPRPVTPACLETVLCSLGQVAHRDGVRRPARVPARVGGPSGLLRGRVKDISCTGLFLALQAALPVEALVSISLRLPVGESRPSIRARGIVVRQVARQPESHLIPGVGIRFVELDARMESLIGRYVNQAITGDEPAPGVVAQQGDA